MNNLSWLIYWANVLPSVSEFLIFFIGAIFLGATLVLVFAYVGHVIVTSETEPKENDLKSTQLAMNITRKWWIFSFICIIIGNLIPSQNTFYLIAASEMGEEVVKTPEFSKLKTILNNKLDEIISNDSKDKK